MAEHVDASRNYSHQNHDAKSVRAGNQVVPFRLRDAPALIETLFPAQKVSVEAFKEQTAGHGKALTGLGSYWKGRKPLILNKACILGSLLPRSADLKRDLEVFEMLMAMDDRSFSVRFGRIKPKDIVAKIDLTVDEYFEVSPPGSLPVRSPFNVADFVFQEGGKERVPTLAWKKCVEDQTKRRIEAAAIPIDSYRERVANSDRPEAFADIHDHVWEEVNEHLGTNASSMEELVHQLGIMRFGRRPRVADTFSGSGQISFEAARLGCDAYASDLNPISCMLTWGAFNIVGGSPEMRAELEKAQANIVTRVRQEIAALGIERRNDGWTAKVFLYCIETTCPQTGWTVPMIPSMVISKASKTIAKLIPDPVNKRYLIDLVENASLEQMKAADKGTIQDGYLVHEVDGVVYRTKVSTLRGDYTTPDGKTRNNLRQWDKSDVVFRDDDIYRERLYAIQWQGTVETNGKRKSATEFRSVTQEDLEREQRVTDYVRANLASWQTEGHVPDSRIESGAKTDEPVRTRGWTHWHHLFNPRQLLLGALFNMNANSLSKPGVLQALNWNSRLSRWNPGNNNVQDVFYNQSLNTLYNFGCRASEFAFSKLAVDNKHFPLPPEVITKISSHPAASVSQENDIYVTDPPYGDAVKYEEILEFFIAWLRKNPPKEFSDWVWDSRRSLAIKGEDHDFKLAMVAAYKRMAEMMPDNGIQVLMFTHQSGSIWADMANIVWASGLHVSAAWYVVTETDSALRDGSYVKGTVLLVLRKRNGKLSTFRDDLALELRDEVEAQVKTLTGLNQDTKDLYREENLFADSDLQMAGYAAALRVLTRYAEIDGVDMTVEALRPREKGKKTRVDTLIDYAVEIANQYLIPAGFAESHWSKLQPAERFYLKMLDMEAKKTNTLDNYQNFAKAFKVNNFKSLMASDKANNARLKSGFEFGRTDMSGESELMNTPLRGVLYALMELEGEVEPDDVLNHLSDNVSDYFRKRDMVVSITDFMASRLPSIRENEAGHARVLRDLVRNERLA